MAKIKIKNSVTTGSVPAGLSFGEVAINIPDKKIFVGNAVESTVTLYDPNNHVLSFNGQTGAVSFVNYVSSVNGATGAVTNVAKTDTAQTFTQLQSFSVGITASGATFTGDIAINGGDITTTSTTASLYNNTATTINIGTQAATTTNIGKNEHASTVSLFGGNLSFYKASSGSIYSTIADGSADGMNIQYNGAGGSISIGDPESVNTGTKIVVNPDNDAIQFYVAGSAYSFPTTAGSNGQVLTTDGAGLLSWAASSGFTYTASAPGSPSIGDRWMDSDTGKEYIYISDGDSSQWIQPVASNGLVGITYDSSTNSYTVGATLDFKGSVSSDGGFRITANAINALTGTTYSLLSSDNGKVITWSNAGGVTLTVPSGLPVGFNTTIIQIGAGAVGITGSGTTLNSFEGKRRTAGQHAAVSIISYSSNVFNIAGGLTA
jgi:hypothetical protein